MKVGDLARYTSDGFFVEEGDIVRIVSMTSGIFDSYVYAYAVKWDKIGAPPEFAETGISLYAQHLALLPRCMFEEVM